MNNQHDHEAEVLMQDAKQDQAILWQIDSLETVIDLAKRTVHDLRQGNLFCARKSAADTLTQAQTMELGASNLCKQALAQESSNQPERGRCCACYDIKPHTLWIWIDHAPNTFAPKKMCLKCIAVFGRGPRPVTPMTSNEVNDHLEDVSP